MDDCPCCNTWSRVRDESLARAHAAEHEAKVLREALAEANRMVVKHTMPFGWPDFQKRHGLPDAGTVLSESNATDEK